MKLETVTIKTENGPVVINKDDFDPKEHELFGAKPKAKRKPRAKKAAE